MELRVFLRVLVLGSLAVCGLETFASSGSGGGGSFNNNMDYSDGGRGGNGTVIIRLRIGVPTLYGIINVSHTSKEP